MATRAEVFACIDAAFAQRRKTLRAALTGWAGSAPRAEAIPRRRVANTGLRGERLGITEFAAVAGARAALVTGPT